MKEVTNTYIKKHHIRFFFALLGLPLQRILFELTSNNTLKYLKLQNLHFMMKK